MANSMQHRHFTLIAETIAALPDINDYTRETIASSFADTLHHTNDNFSRSRFIACAMGKPINGRDKTR